MVKASNQEREGPSNPGSLTKIDMPVAIKHNKFH
jgi:hypothetical protein